MTPHYKGIPFTATDAAQNINGSKTSHLIRVKWGMYNKAFHGMLKNIPADKANDYNAINKGIADYLNAHAPYKPGDVVYQKEKITHNAFRWAIYDCDSAVVNVCCGLGDCMDIDYVDQSERGFIPRTQMPMKYARLWLQIASCEAKQVDGVWHYGITYSKTEKPKEI